MDIVSIINTLAQAGTAIGVIIAIIALRHSADVNRKQMNMQVFMTFTDRYEKIMTSFPENAFSSRFNLQEALPPESKELTVATLKYLNLTSEEYYLWKGKYLDDKVWKIWEAEIKRTLNSPMFQREWPKLEPEFVSYPEFVRFVRNV